MQVFSIKFIRIISQAGLALYFTYVLTLFTTGELNKRQCGMDGE